MLASLPVSVFLFCWYCMTVSMNNYSVTSAVGLYLRADEVIFELIFIETQTGTYFGEDDIVRIEDDYGRE